MKIKSILFFICILTSSLGGKKEIPRTGIYIPELKQLDFTVIQFMEKWKIPGGSVAIIKDEKLIYARSFGNDADGYVLENTTPLKIASLSKPLTSIGILKLVEQNKIRLDDYVFGKAGILNDEIYSNINDDRIFKITVENLLNHTAGWDRELSMEKDPMFNPFVIAREMSIPAPADKITIIRYMLQKPLDFNPGEKYSYSNLGYNILGRIIEKLSGKTYEEYMQESVLQPMGINNMTLATNDEYKYNSTSKYPFINIESMDAHGGWKATAIDLSKVLLGTDPKHYRTILDGHHLRLMQKGSISNPGYGYGWFVNNYGNCWHTGSLNGCSAFMARLSNGLGAVVIFNERPDNELYFNELDGLVWKGLKGIKEWPGHDLFNSVPVAGSEPSLLNSVPAIH